MPDSPVVIEGRVVHKKSNALQITFHDGPDDPLAIGVQGANDKAGKKLGNLFGFKNGGVGHHRLTWRDGTVLGVQSKDGAPSVLTRQDGVELATVRRGATSSAVLAGGAELLTFADDPDEAKSLELFRLRVHDQQGTELGRLDVIRRSEGWTTLSQATSALVNELYWMTHAGGPLPVPILGTRLTLTRAPSDVEREVLLGACTDIALGLRPYATGMQ